MPEESKTATIEDTVAGMSDDALAEMWHDLSEEAERLGRLAWGAHHELYRRLVDRGATALETDHWSGKVKPGAISHTIDDPQRLRRRLGKVLLEDEIRQIFVQPPAPPVRVDQRQLNEVHKRGGEVAGIIDEERTSVRGEGHLVLERKREVA